MRDRDFVPAALRILCTVAVCLIVSSHVLAQRPPATVLIVVGPSQHPPGTHEVAAGARVIEHCLRNPKNLPALDARVLHDWPADRDLLARVSSVVFLGDLFPPERLEQPERVKTDLAAMIARGCGMVCIHYATGLRAEHVSPEGNHPLLHWIGGYFATRCLHHQSVARVLTATIRPGETEHPVLRGWKAFTLEDEPYYNNYFGKEGLAKNVTPLATAMLPPEAPRLEVVAWAAQRDDGGRGMGVVMPHFFRNWQVDDLRKFILNGIVWSAKLEVPADGVDSTLPDLATFQPEAVQPQPRPGQQKKAVR